MTEAINTYAGGIDQDTSPQKSKNVTYYMLSDGHIVTEEGLTSGAVENDKGTTLAFSLPDTQNIYKLTLALDSTSLNTTILKGYISVPTAVHGMMYVIPAGYTMEQALADIKIWYATEIASGKFAVVRRFNEIWFVGLNAPLTVMTSAASDNTSVLSLEVPAQTGLHIIGSGTIRDEIVICTTNCESSTPGKNLQASSYGQLWKFKFDELSKVVAGSTSTGVLVPSNHLYYNNILNFSSYNRVKSIVSRYEGEEFSKIYFADGYNNLRHFNFNNEYHFILSPAELELLSDVEMEAPKLESVSFGGGLISGRYQYCYQLYNQYGSETVISPIGDLIDVTNYDETVNESYLYRGNGVNKDCNRTIAFKISNIDPRFDSIRIIRLQYSDLYADPDINIIEERNTSGSTMTFSDSGENNIGSLTRTQLTDLGGKVFIPQTLEIKNSKLFAGNITEENFDIDFDARCFRYRWDAVQNSEVTYANHIVAGEEGDDINPYNVLTNDNNASCRYIYQKNKALHTVGDVTNVRLGGTGLDQFSLGVPNIEYTFNMMALDGDHGIDENLSVVRDSSHTSPIDSIPVNNSWYNYKSPYMSEHFRGYQRDEVYRFGIVFFDKKHRPSFVKWIGDIRMPAMADRDSANSDGYVVSKYVDYMVNKNQIYALYPTFTVNIPTSIATKISGFSIVRVKRTGNDRTILAQGLLSRGFAGKILIGTTGDDASCQFAVPIGNMFNPLYNPYLLSPYEWDDYTFLSPEINFNKNITKESTDNFRIEAQFDAVAFDPKTRHTAKLTSAKTYTTTGITTSGNLTWDQEVANATEKDFVESINTVQINELYNDGSNMGGTAAWGKISHSTSLIRELFHRNTSNTHHALVNYRRLRVSQYGGPSLSARQQNEYISCNNFTKVSDMTDNGSYLTAEVNVFGGDTFVGYYDYFRGQASTYSDPDTGDFYPAGPRAVYFPCESSINVELRHDGCYSRTGKLGLVEYDNDFTNDIGYPYETKDLYAYNAVYSRESDLTIYFPKPFNYQGQNVHDCRIQNSQRRFTDQQVDNWLTFKTNDYTEVDQSYGPITRLIDWNNVLYFVQSSGVGAISVDERATTVDATGSTIVLGSGETLGKYGYVTKVSGSIHHDSIIASAVGLHYFDVRNRKWMLFTGEGQIPLNSVKGLHAFFMNNLKGYIQTTDKPLSGSPYSAGIAGAYDIKNGRVIMTFLDWKKEATHNHIVPVAERYTVTFNERMNAFEKMNKYYPGQYLYTRDRLIGIPVNSNKAYIHNTGEYGKYYDSTSYVPLELTIVVNDSAEVNKIFTNLEFNSQVLLNGMDQFNETIDKIEIWNSYQNTGIVNLVPDYNIRRRRRTWRLQIARHNDPSATNFNPADQSDARISDRYIFIKVTFTNNGNKRFVLHDLITTFIGQNQ